VISQRSAPRIPAPRSNSLAATDSNAESLFELLAWEAANAPTDSSHVESANGNLPPVAPLDGSVLFGEAATAEPDESSTAPSLKQLESANELEAEIVDELFGDDLLKLPELL
jgi:hypothetical protein